MHIGPTKTVRSMCKVKVPQDVVALMNEFKAEQDEYKCNMDDKWQGKMFSSPSMAAS